MDIYKNSGINPDPVPLKESLTKKGGVNPPNTSNKRPPPPGGSAPKELISRDIWGWSERLALELTRYYEEDEEGNLWFDIAKIAAVLRRERTKIEEQCLRKN